MSQNMGLGRGLSSLIPKKVPENAISKENKKLLSTEESDRILKIPVDLIEVNPHQPRTEFDHDDLEDLMDSIKKHGIIQPLIVTKKQDGYQLIAGERRLRAAKILGLETVPAIVRQVGEQEKMELALIENIQRKNLNPIEKAIAYRKMIEEFSLSQEKIAERLGVGRSTITNSMRYLELPSRVQESLASGLITEGHAKNIAGLENEKKQLALLDKIVKNNYSVRETEKHVKTDKTKIKKKMLTKLQRRNLKKRKICFVKS